jgi:two-component system KDP operon response regulator KdpE
MSTILIVDDDAPLLRLFHQILKLNDYASLLANNGQVGLELLAAGSVDLVILDLDMPVMNGREFFRHLVAQPRRPPVLIVSAFEPGLARKELGAEGAMKKPFEPEALLNEVAYLLGRNPVLSANSDR